MSITQHTTPGGVSSLVLIASVGILAGCNLNPTERAFYTGEKQNNFFAPGFLAGSSQHPLESGFSDRGRTQIQFFTPPGANVTVKDCPPRTHQVATYGPFDNRLEQSPEEFCVFNLPPGQHKFKYVSAEGLPGVSVYGELDVKRANSETAARFQRLAFIPVALPSEYYKKVEINGNEIYPYRGEAYRTAIDESDVMRLKQGDMVEKVFFVADLEKADKLRNQLIRDLKVMERKMEKIETRFRQAYRNYIGDPPQNNAEENFDKLNPFAADKNYEEWESDRQQMSIQYEMMQKKLKRTQALLKGDTVLIRKGMLALATEEIVKPYRDVEDASEKLGEVLLVMRIGGRHMQWGDPRKELASFEQPK